MLPRQLRQPHLVVLYQQYLEDENTAGFVRAVSERYNVATLERLVTTGSRDVRRAAAMALGFLGDINSTAVMSRGLHDADQGVRLLSDAGVRELWCRDGSDDQRRQLRRLLRLNLSERFDEAVDAATEMLDTAPWFAEAWNQRGIAYFQLQQYEEAASDCRQALERNPHHFGAAVGLAHCHLELNDPYAALEAFRQALEINPDLEGVRHQVEFLEQSLEGRPE